MFSGLLHHDSNLASRGIQDGNSIVGIDRDIQRVTLFEILVFKAFGGITECVRPGDNRLKLPGIGIDFDAREPFLGCHTTPIGKMRQTDRITATAESVDGRRCRAPVESDFALECVALDTMPARVGGTQISIRVKRTFFPLQVSVVLCVFLACL